MSALLTPRSAAFEAAVAAAASGLVFVGNDDTDEVAFRAEIPVPALTVRVGRVAESAATFHVQHRVDVDRLLDTLTSMREPATRRRRAAR